MAIAKCKHDKGTMVQWMDIANRSVYDIKRGKPDGNRRQDIIILWKTNARMLGNLAEYQHRKMMMASKLGEWPRLPNIQIKATLMSTAIRNVYIYNTGNQSASPTFRRTFPFPTSKSSFCKKQVHHKQISLTPKSYVPKAGTFGTHINYHVTI